MKKHFRQKTVVFFLVLGLTSLGGKAIIPSQMIVEELGSSSGSVSQEAQTTVSATDVQTLIDHLSFEQFKEIIRTLTGFGDREQGSQSNIDAALWLERELETTGYTVERHSYSFRGQSRDNVYVTKIGTSFPDRMYIVSAHMDGRGGGGAADDDGSGTALVLAAALALAQPDVETQISVRFIFWNNEETGLNGSQAYVRDRATLQGVEFPLGSGLYPEPRWLGIIQHDMLLYDHGLPPRPSQIPTADIDVEYQLASRFALQSLQLASALQMANEAYSDDYPAEVGANMNFTDSVSFQEFTAAVSVRENQRVAEIGNGSNPHWHRPTDVFQTYSDADFNLGFNALQMTLGAVAELAGARLIE